MSKILNSRLACALCALVAANTSADWSVDLEERAQAILKPVQIAAEKTQLDSEEKHLLGIEDTRFVPAVGPCADQIANSIAAWKDKYNIVSSKQEIKDSRVYIEIDSIEPIQGALIVIYRYLSADDKAYVKFLFDSNERIDATQQEMVVARYRLVELKLALVENMKCAGGG